MITHSKQTETKAKPGRLHRPRIIVMSLVALALMALLSGCAANTANLQTLAPASTTGIPTALGTAIQPLSSYAAPIPTATPTPPPPGKKQFATVATQGTRVNLRSGPGTNFDIITKANPGASFEYVGTNNGWVQVVVPVAQVTASQATTATQAITQTTAPTRAAWVSSELVRIGAEGEVPVTVDEDPLIPADLTANWSADWVCRSTPAERCNLQGKTNCTAKVTAAVTRPVNGTLLPVELKGTWDDEACGTTEVWTQQVDQFNGKEAGGDGDNDFTSNYWAGVQPGDANGVLPLDDERGVMVYCSGPHQQEIPGLDGWALVQEGYTCHDVKTGMLVYISFTSKYLFTGTLDGKDYEKAFFGDVTKLEQKLTETNAGLAYVEAKE